MMVSKRAIKEKESLDEHLLSINKLIYLICIHESQSALANQAGPGLIQGREHWIEIETYLITLKAIKALEHY